MKTYTVLINLLASVSRKDKLALLAFTAIYASIGLFDLVGISLLYLLFIKLSNEQDRTLSIFQSSITEKFESSWFFENNTLSFLTISILFIIKGVIAIALTQLLFRYLHRYTISFSKSNLRDIFNLPSFNNSKFSSEYLNFALGEGPIWLYMGVLSSGMLIIADAFLLLALVSFILITNPIFSFIFLTYVIGTFFAISNLISKRTKKVNAEKTKALIEFNRTVKDTFSIYREIRLLENKSGFEDLIEDSQSRIAKAQSKLNVYNSIPKHLLEVILVSAFGMILGITLLSETAPTPVFGANFLILLATIARATPCLLRMQSSISLLNASLGISEVSNKLSDDLRIIKSNQRESEILHFTESDYRLNILKLRNVSFVSDSGKMVLDNINLTIASGDKIAIVGESGSGKSTLLDILAGVIVPTSGSYIIDENIGPSNLDFKKLVSYSPQAKNLISGNIYQNISLDFSSDTKIEKERLREVTEFSKIDFIKNVSSNDAWMNLPLSEKLSGGEISRICIARCLFKPASLFLFDEPTSAMDYKLSRDILTNVMEFCKESIVVISLHEEELLSFFNRVIRVKDGKIIEDSDLQF